MTSTMSSNRIPIKVKHADVSFNDDFTSSTGFRVPTPGTTHFNINNNNNNNDELYRMNKLSDETDQIKIRMKEFEDRCKKWREEFFSKSNTHFTPLTTDFDQRVPPNTSFMSSGTPFSTHDTTSSKTNRTSSLGGGISPQIGSSLHKSYIEDTGNGGKKYKIEFEIGDFKANELAISTKGKVLLVKGDREIKAGSATETKTFNREISLPDYVDTNSLNAYLLDLNANNNNNTSSISYSNSLINQNSSNSILVIEAAISNEKYYSRRTNISPSPPPRSSSSHKSPNNDYNRTVPSFSPSRNTTATSSSQYNTIKTNNSAYSSKSTTQQPETTHYYEATSVAPSQQTKSDKEPQTQSQALYSTVNAPELMIGLPTLNKDDGYTIYKFDFRGFDQNEINLSITETKALEIKACKVLSDSLGKTYREYKREIQLNDSVDVNLIKNLLSDGLLTIKIPGNQSPQEQRQHKLTASLNSGKDFTDINNNNTNANSGNFREIHSPDGKLTKITYDLQGYEPENLKIVLSTSNTLKITAQQFDKSGTNRIIRQSSRQFNLPSYIQPENMKAIMSRDGLLTIDFSNENSNNTGFARENNADQRIYVKA